MTTEELTKRQRWTLNQKIGHTVGTLEAFLQAVNGKGYVSFSGGKDSTVLLDIARRYVNRDIKGCFCNTGNEYPDIVQFVRSCENIDIVRPELTIKEVIGKYGFPLISKEQAQGIRDVRHTKSQRLRQIRLYGTDPERGHTSGKISEKWKFLIAAPFDISEKCCECLKKRPLKKYSKVTGLSPILGTMATESQLRKRNYIRRNGCNVLTPGKEVSQPLSIWTDSDVWEYLRRNKVRYAGIYDKGASRTGCMFCGFGACAKGGASRFWLPFENYPKFYDLFMNYTNNGITYREALHYVGVELPDDLL